MADLSGKVAVVTGGCRGLGRGIAEGLAEAGATIYITGRSESFARPPAAGSVQATALRVEELGGRGIPVRLDQGNDEEVRALFRQVHSEQGRLDLLVNSAWQAGDSHPGGFWEQPVALWDQASGANLRNYYVAATFATPLLVAQGSGLLVNISSPADSRRRSSLPDAVARAGADRMARDMARELEPWGVAALALWPEPPQAPRFIGRCVAALTMDPDILEKTGGAYRVAELAREYRFSEPQDP